MDLHAAPTDVLSFTMGIVPQVDTVTLDGAACIGGNRVPVAFDIEPGSEGYVVRVDGDDAMAYSQSCCGPTTGVTIVGRAGAVARGAHRYDLPARKIAASARREPLVFLKRGRAHFDDLLDGLVEDFTGDCLSTNLLIPLRVHPVGDLLFAVLTGLNGLTGANA